MRAYDSLLQADDALNALRSRRIQEMQDRQNMMRKWKSLGHGVYTKLGGGSVQVSVDIAKAFFEASKESDRLVARMATQ
jgi:hypothetical protein